MTQVNPHSEALAFISENKIFAGLSSAQLELLVMQAVEVTFAKDEIIIHENEVGDEFYIIKQGKVEVTKYDNELGRRHHIGEAGKGDAIGEMSLIDSAPRSASVRAVEPTTLYMFSINKLRSPVRKKSFLSKLLNLDESTKTKKTRLPVYSVIVQNIAKNVSHRLRTTNESVVASLRNELIHEKARAAMSRFVINILVLLSFYVLILQIIVQFKSQVISTTAISIPLMIVLVLPLVLMMKLSGYPMSLYGFTTRNWRMSLTESLLFTLPVLAFIVIYKWILIHTSESFANRDLFDLSLSLIPGTQVNSIWVGAGLILGYMIFVPVQELLARGALQSSFQVLLTGKNSKLWAILLSNLLFSVFHSHVSLGFGLIVYLPGLFWGWLYARHHTLIGVTVSHLIIGAWAIFIVGLI